MGNEAQCRVEIDGEAAEAKALLETEELILRGAVKAKIAFRDARDVIAEEGVLRLRWNERDVRIHLGSSAAKWAEKIRNPKSVADKLGVKPGQKISVVGTIDAGFLAASSKKLQPNSDLIFFAANAREDLARLPQLRENLAPAGAIWVVRPKGASAISEGDVMAEAKAAGLVDVKVVRFSDTHTAEKLVIPVSKRS
ncbi:MAG TPA: hypothetical protein VEK11_09595 [Thermoanaerobaculia bacterium]|nr:hypothetical protein [Thermoanaerobaculia bacterium]